MNRMRRTRRGFTLIEILAVIAILGIVGTVAVVKYMAYVKSASVKTAEVKIREAAKTIEIYYYQNQRFPETLDELVTPEDETKEGVLKRSALFDPWKNELQYEINEGGDPPFDLISFGPDGMEGTDDDIRYSALEDDLEEDL